MIKPKALHFDKVWGYEEWIASTYKGGLQPEFEQISKDYPLLVKIIQADQTLSVQVHPDDADAHRLEGNTSRGKTECWYILSAEKDAKLVYGLNGVYTKEQLAEAIKNNILEESLNFIPVHRGDFIFIPAGTVHAIGAGIRLLEVQQSSDITYRLYDWGRPRELHIEKGLQVIKDETKNEVCQFQEQFTCSFFTLEKISVNGAYGMITQSLQLLFIINGSGVIHKSATSQDIPFQSEQLFIVEKGEKITVEGHAAIMKITANQNE